MARKCVFISCSITSEKYVSKFPKDQLLKEVWKNEIIQGTKSKQSCNATKEKNVCEVFLSKLHFEEDQWGKNSNRKCLKSSAIPAVFLQTLAEDYANIYFVLFLRNRDKRPLLKLLNVLKQPKTCVGRKNKETQKVWERLGMLLVKSELQKVQDLIQFALSNI